MQTATAQSVLTNTPVPGQRPRKSRLLSGGESQAKAGDGAGFGALVSGGDAGSRDGMPSRRTVGEACEHAVVPQPQTAVLAGQDAAPIVVIDWQVAQPAAPQVSNERRSVGVSAIGSGAAKPATAQPAAIVNGHRPAVVGRSKAVPQAAGVARDASPAPNPERIASAGAAATANESLARPALLTAPRLAGDDQSRPVRGDDHPLGDILRPRFIKSLRSPLGESSASLSEDRPRPWHGHVARASQGRPAPAPGGNSAGETPVGRMGETPMPRFHSGSWTLDAAASAVRLVPAEPGTQQPGGSETGNSRVPQGRPTADAGSRVAPAAVPAADRQASVSSTAAPADRGVAEAVAGGHLRPAVPAAPKAAAHPPTASGAALRAAAPTAFPVPAREARAVEPTFPTSAREAPAQGPRMNAATPITPTQTRPQGARTKAAPAAETPLPAAEMPVANVGTIAAPPATAARAAVSLTETAAPAAAPHAAAPAAVRAVHVGEAMHAVLRAQEPAPAVPVAQRPARIQETEQAAPSPLTLPGERRIAAPPRAWTNHEADGTGRYAPAAWRSSPAAREGRPAVPPEIAVAAPLPQAQVRVAESGSSASPVQAAPQAVVPQAAAAAAQPSSPATDVAALQNPKQLAEPAAARITIPVAAAPAEPQPTNFSTGPAPVEAAAVALAGQDQVEVSSTLDAAPQSAAMAAQAAASTTATLTAVASANVTPPLEAQASGLEWGSLQLVEGFATIVSGSASEVVLRLDPPELGSLRLTVRAEGSEVRAVVEADSHRTLSELRAEAPALVQRLADSGVQVRGLEMVLAGGGDSQAQTPWQGDWGGGRQGPVHEQRGGYGRAMNEDGPAGGQTVSDDAINIWV